MGNLWPEWLALLCAIARELAKRGLLPKFDTSLGCWTATRRGTTTYHGDYKDAIEHLARLEL